MNVIVKKKRCMVIGNPVAHSLSPVMHTAGYKALAIDDLFEYTASTVLPEDLGAYVASIKTLGITGVSCTAPHKIELVNLMDELDPTVRIIGALNTVVNRDSHLIGYNTDWIGVIKPLEKHGSLRGKKVAIIGSGGVARAAVYGLSQNQAALTIFNRTYRRAVDLASEFNVSAQPLSALPQMRQFDIVINTVSVPELTKEILGYMHPQQTIFDLTYSQKSDQLLNQAQQNGIATINGKEMLLYQGMAQFKLFTGYNAPETAMRKALQISE